MIDTRKQRRTKLAIRIVGGFFALLGLLDLISSATGWIAAGTVDVTCNEPLYLLMLVGGGLLIAIRPAGLEIVFILMRLYVLFGLLGVAVSLLLLKPLPLAISIAMLLPAFGLMAFLSREATQSVFRKEETGKPPE